MTLRPNAYETSREFQRRNIDGTWMRCALKFNALALGEFSVVAQVSLLYECPAYGSLEASDVNVGHEIEYNGRVFVEVRRGSMRKLRSPKNWPAHEYAGGAARARCRSRY